MSVNAIWAPAKRSLARSADYPLLQYTWNKEVRSATTPVHDGAQPSTLTRRLHDTFYRKAKTLREHQKDLHKAFEQRDLRRRNTPAFVVYWQMGSGKTLGATSLMVNHRSTYNLIVSVNTNIQYWVEQVRMTPFITREAVTEGGEAETMVSRFGSSERDIVLWFEVVGYTAFRSDLDNARALEMYNVVCLDEAHYFRNNTQGMKFAIDAIRAKNVILLTGTPLVNDQEDIVGTLKLADCDGVRDWEGEYAATGIANSGTGHRLYEEQRLVFRSQDSSTEHVQEALPWHGG